METMNAIELLISNPIEYAGQKAITLAKMDEVHERPSGTARRTFAKYRNQLREGEDFYSVPGEMVRTQNVRTSDRPGENITLLTETGYLMLVKAFRDPLAWQVQRRLVSAYFRARAVATDPVMAMALDQIGHLHAVVCNFIQGSLAAHDRRIDGLQHAADERFAEVERQLKQLRRGSRVSAMGRASGRDRKVTPRAPKALVAVPPQPMLPGAKP